MQVTQFNEQDEIGRMHERTPLGAFSLRSAPLHILDPSDIYINRMTRMKSVVLAFAGIVELEPPETAGGELHQITVSVTGCSSAVLVQHRLDREAEGKPALTLFKFPVLQSGSFKLEAAFHRGLRVYIAADIGSPPHMTVNWRLPRSASGAPS